VWAREVLNFRGNPTVEAEVHLADGSWGRGVAPAGISTGSSEARQLLDGDSKRFGGRGVLKAVENVRTVLAPALKGMRASRQEEVDQRLRELDGTPDKGRLGANAILGVSLATAQAAAASQKLPLFRYLGGDGPFRLPVPAYDVFQGGEHAEDSVDLQEYLVIPAGLSSFQDAVQAGYAVYQALAQTLKKRGHPVRQTGGPLSAPLKSNEEGLEVIAEAIETAGYKLGDEVFIGLDAATSHLYQDGKYVLASEGHSLTSQELADMWADWIDAYPIISIEDAMAEEDWEGWQAVTKRIGNRVQLVGDDLFTTNPARVRKGIQLGAANAVLVKPNQVGTLSETLETMRIAHAAGYAAMLSTRSGETEDTTISDLAVLAQAGQIKAGPVAGPSMPKYNRLLRIQEELGDRAEYAGRTAFRSLR
ncbi:MAG: phosphopyruvate hydratase, partial [Chloroflexota bacterium]|nr:phosphopyruvate hydratase [Chloroflexota bacterium]